MKIHPFVFNWPRQNPKSTIDALQNHFGYVTVINSSEPQPGWVNLGPDAYFTEQWLKALELFDGDILFHCQADATCDDWPKVVQRALELQDRYGWDNFAPLVDYTFHTRTLEELEPNVYRVPVNDCTCWMLHSRLVQRYLDLGVDWQVNPLGWGHDLIVGALSELAIRDHSVIVDHPKHTGYSKFSARRQMKKMFAQLPSDVRNRIQT